MNTDTINQVIAFRSEEAPDDELDHLFLTWVRATEKLVGRNLTLEAHGEADSMFADGLTPEEAAGEMVACTMVSE